MRSLALGMSLAAGLSMGALIGGCTNLIPPLTVDVDLNSGAGVQFPVAPGQTVQRVVTLTFDTGGLNVTGGTFELKPDAITVVSDAGGPGKEAVVAQTGGGTIDVRARVALPGMAETVCTSSDAYGIDGPYTVTFNENFQVTDIDPSTVTLSENTVAALNSGTVTVCLEITAPISGTVTITTLTFNVSVTLN